MDNSQHLQNELAFLIDQSELTKNKIERAEEALTTCSDSLEESTLKDMLRASQQELIWLNELITRLSHLDPSLSLESLIMRQISDARRTQESLMGRWQRGHATPSGYWEAETRLNMLTTLLAHYHAWMDASPTENISAETPAAEPSSGDETGPETDGLLSPWYPSDSTKINGDAPQEAPQFAHGTSPDPLIAIEDAVYAALDRTGCPEGYVEVVVESPEMVIVRGSARSSSERDALLTAVMSVEAVQEVLTDIRVLPPDQAPEALYDRHQRDDARHTHDGG